MTKKRCDSQQAAIAIRRHDGRKVGEVRGDVFHKDISGSVHLLQKPPALAFDVQSLYDAEKAGAQVVQVRDRESGITYSASLKTVMQRGTLFDRGRGRQIFLPLAMWTRDGEKQDASYQLALLPT